MKAIRGRQLAIKSGAQEIHIETISRVAFVEGDRSGRNLVLVWFEVRVDDEEPLTKKLMKVAYTDQEFPDDYIHVGSGTLPNGKLVHVLQCTTPIEEKTDE